jgi:hypothetical protein
MYIAVIIIIAKLWNQPVCSSIDGLIKKMWYTYTMEYYSTIQENEIMSPAGNGCN